MVSRTARTKLSPLQCIGTITSGSSALISSITLELRIGRRAEMETADQRVNLLHAGDLLRLFRRIHDPDMTAGADDDEPAVLHVKAGRMLVQMLVVDDLADLLGRRVMAALQPRPSFMANSTRAPPVTFSTVVRLILPVVKAWPITAGVSASTVLTFRDASSRRSSVPHWLRPGSPCTAILARRAPDGGCRSCPRRRHRA